MENKKLMASLGMIALLRPLMKMTGWIHIFGNEAVGSIAMTILISLVWVAIVVKKEVVNPVQTLVGAGVCYAGLAIIASGILSPILDGSLQGPLTNPIALVSVFITNIVWGLILGIIVLMIPAKKRK